MRQGFIGDIVDRMYYVITFILKYIYFKKAEVAIFADKILTMFIIYKDSRKVKISRKYESKCNLYLYFLI